MGVETTVQEEGVVGQEEQRENDGSKSTRESSDVEIISSEGNTGKKLTFFHFTPFSAFSRYYN